MNHFKHVIGFALVTLLELRLAPLQRKQLWRAIRHNDLQTSHWRLSMAISE